MLRTRRFLLAAVAVSLAAALAGCSPKTDVTDPLSDYSVNVNVPFSTSGPGAYLKTASPASTSGIVPEVKIVGWLNELMDVSEQNAYTELTVGSIGTAVKNLQKRLIELGYMSGTASGSFDQATAQAVRLFESSYGRTATGVATPLMQVYLFSMNAKTYNASSVRTTVNPGNNETPTYTETYSRLQRGDTGAAVTRLQNRLIELGYLSGSATGIFDANTENAVKGFEAAYGKQRTGIATPAMQEYVYSQNAYRAGTATPTPTIWNANTASTSTPTPTPDPAAAYTALQYGSKGESVKRLQSRLRELGYMTSKVDGIYGNATVNAVKAFEAAYNQPQTGVASAGMQRYLFAEDAIPFGAVTPTPTASSSNGYSTLSKGSYGDEVVRLQKRLIELGYLKGKADGYFGDATAAAVKAFETRYGRAQSGVATAVMQQYLFDENAVRASDGTQTQTDYTLLSQGSYGTEVLALQNRLSELGYLVGNADGYYGSSTVAAIKRFEAAYHHEETGVATKSLQETLFSDDALEYAIAAPTTGAYKRLKKGDRGDDVAKLQLRLIELGYLSGTVDGYYGDGTADAVKAFEAAYSQTLTGVASALLQTYLFADDAIPNDAGDVAVSYTTLESGDSGQLVWNLQARLIELGYMSGSPDGEFGSGTVAAVKAFQKEIGVKQTGAASAATQKALFASDAPGKSADEIVTVNKPAYVTASQTNVYAKAGDAKPIAVITVGMEVTILRTRGEWAEIRNASGNIGYARLSDLAISQKKEDDSGLSGVVTSVNATAAVNADQIIVFSTPSKSAERLGTLNRGAKVLWTRVNGIWAEIRNSSGETGYVLAENLTLTPDENTESSSVYQTLRSGDKGDDVKKIQKRLTELDYFYGDIGGNYLTKTTAAVKAFESAIGLKPTGVATPGLQAIMFSNAAPKHGKYKASAERAFATLSMGSKGDAVEELQLKLLSLGYLDASRVSFRSYDQVMKNAVANVQTAMGISPADGVAGPELQAFILSNASKAIQR